MLINWLPWSGSIHDRIVIGLDPALPFFATQSPSQKLDATDADFVDVIHTNAGYFGKIEACGHLDFYMNGGQTQPTCYNHKSKLHVLDEYEVYFISFVGKNARIQAIPENPNSLMYLSEVRFRIKIRNCCIGPKFYDWPSNKENEFGFAVHCLRQWWKKIGCTRNRDLRKENSQKAIGNLDRCFSVFVASSSFIFIFFFSFPSSHHSQMCHCAATFCRHCTLPNP